MESCASAPTARLDDARRPPGVSGGSAYLFTLGRLLAARRAQWPVTARTEDTMKKAHWMALALLAAPMAHARAADEATQTANDRAERVKARADADATRKKDRAEAEKDKIKAQADANADSAKAEAKAAKADAKADEKAAKKTARSHKKAVRRHSTTTTTTQDDTAAPRDTTGRDRSRRVEPLPAAPSTVEALRLATRSALRGSGAARRGMSLAGRYRRYSASPRPAARLRCHGIPPPIAARRRRSDRHCG